MLRKDDAALHRILTLNLRSNTFEHNEKLYGLRTSEDRTEGGIISASDTTLLLNVSKKPQISVLLCETYNANCCGRQRGIFMVTA